MKNREKLSKLNSLLLCLQAHPDNEPDSEFADRIEDIKDIIKHELSKDKKQNDFSISFADWFVKNNYEKKVGYYEASDLIDFYKEHIY